MSDKLLVILDLDQTIISSEASLELTNAERNKLAKKFESYGMMDETHKDAEVYRVYQRPYLQEFFDFINDNSDKFRLAVWTAASRPYATSIVENYYYSKKCRKPLEFVFFDDHVAISENHLGNHKDLRLLWDVYPQYGADMGNSVIIDDNKIVYGPQPRNAIRAPAFYVREKDAVKDDFLATLPQKLLKAYYAMEPTEE
jgi:TFIIF-interacting CTD phosphatase-like protein